MHKKVKRYEKYLNPYIIIPILLGIHAFLLRSFGRNLICWCGNIKLFVFESNSPEGSQQIADYYTFSHIIHGRIFYAILFKLVRKLSVQTRFLIAVIIETLWEIVENTPMVINHYRSGTVSDIYNGDSILNSLFDIIAMMFGFYLAKKLPVWASISLVIIMELIAFFVIRDNLTLNILMFLYPFKFIQQWQAGA